MRFIGEDLKEVTNQLGRMALALNSTMNTQHQLGVDLHGGTGNDFFVPAADAPGLPLATNTGTGVNIVRLSDGQVSAFAGLPAVLDGLSFQLDSGDSFLVKPFAALTFLADGSFTATGLGPGNPPPDNVGPPASYNYTPGQPLQFNG